MSIPKIVLPTNALVHYIFKKKGRGVGVLVGIMGEDGIPRVGWSKCHSKDKGVFSKEDGLSIALRRAMADEASPIAHSLNKWAFEGYINKNGKKVDSFVMRCTHYFRHDMAVKGYIVSGITDQGNPMLVEDVFMTHFNANEAERRKVEREAKEVARQAALLM